MVELQQQHSREQVRDRHGHTRENTQIHSSASPGRFTTPIWENHSQQATEEEEEEECRKTRSFACAVHPHISMYKLGHFTDKNFRIKYKLWSLHSISASWEMKLLFPQTLTVSLWLMHTFWMPYKQFERSKLTPCYCLKLVWSRSKIWTQVYFEDWNVNIV